MKRRFINLFLNTFLVLSCRMGLIFSIPKIGWVVCVCVSLNTTHIRENFQLFAAGCRCHRGRPGSVGAPTGPLLSAVVCLLFLTFVCVYVLIRPAFKA